MDYLVITMIVAVAGLLALLHYARREAQREGTSTSKELAGICAAATHRTFMKEANKTKALELLAEQGELSNSDLRHAIGVSRRTVVNYMSELEKEGRVKQVGDAGRGVLYQLK